ncbi:hypothetical protein AB205_0135270 [Aquarana catesbeiana]|uniref:Uncharacterized protein n=1 Tax=Aquarana catesbeiana TaxID=8400 RepID=A0A2G9S2R6_AQUCT|nr:hypothetical protein AB205_0135270 [Aquarana catesbeiana]
MSPLDGDNALPMVQMNLKLMAFNFFFYSETLEIVLAAGGALLFCGFIIYDTHMLMHKLSPEEHIIASINLYLDVINLFLHLLRLLEAILALAMSSL